MSIWSTVKNSVEQGMWKMKSFYDQKGIYDIRVNYASWIEERLSREKSCSIDQAALQFYNDLEKHIRESAGSSTLECLNIINQMKQIAPQDFYSHISEGIAHEILLISQIPPTTQTDQLVIIYNRIHGLVKACNEFYQIPNLDMGGNSNKDEHCDPVNYLQKMFDEYEYLQNSVLIELKSWKKQQVLVGNDVPQNESLNQIQGCVELLVEITFRMLQLIESIRMRNPSRSDERLERLSLGIQKQQEKLMLASFVVDNQPTQVIKKNTNFGASVRWLVGPQLGLNRSISEVECIFVTEAQAKRLHADGDFGPSIESSSSEVIQNKVKMEYDKEKRVLSANFKNMILKKIQRSERRGSTESVMDEKLALLFYMTVTVNGSSFRIWTLSLPVVVIVHVNQEHQAWATVIWDNGFAEMDREPFKVPDRVTWEKLSNTLCAKCFSLTGQGFSEANKYFLYEMLVQTDNMMIIDPNVEISWGKFCKDTLPPYNFTFWIWFYSTIKLIKDRLVDLWNANLIEGFISKKATEEKLKFCDPGTFLLRFSNSVLGGISIAYVDEVREITHITPWTCKELQTRGLADRIKDLENLQYLYPGNIDKSAFYMYCTPDDKIANNGYVPGVPKTTIIKRNSPPAQTQNIVNPFLEVDMDMLLENEFTPEVSFVDQLVLEMA